MLSILEQALRLLHPFMPYLTEELWQNLPIDHAQLLHRAYVETEPTIMLAAYPQVDQSLIDEGAETAMQAMIDLISRVRNIRSEINIRPGERIKVLIGAPDENLRRIYQINSDQIARLTRASQVLVSDSLKPPKASARGVLAGGAEVAVPLEGLIDFELERQRLLREKEKLDKETAKLEAQLGNADFVERAPMEKVEELRARIADIAQRKTALDQMLEALA